VKEHAQHTPAEHERGLVQAFFLPRRRGRYLELLARPGRRGDVLRGLAHFKHLDPRRIVQIAARFQHARDILTILKEKGAPEICYGISEWGEVDGKSLPLLDALQMVVGAGMGTFLSCVPGKLAFFESEDERCILERTNSAKTAAAVSGKKTSASEKEKGRFKNWRYFSSETPSTKKSKKRSALGLCIGCGKNPCGCKHPKARRSQ
jgi:hypothetical protein